MKLFETLIKFRYLFIIVVIFLLINSLAFMIAGVVQCVHGYTVLAKMGFATTEEIRPGTYLLEGLDFFMSSLVFMVFGLGLGRLFLFNEESSKSLPSWLQISSLKQLKVLLWETILVALVIFCVTHLIRSDLKSWDILAFPVLILILALALFLVKGKEAGTD